MAGGKGGFVLSQRPGRYKTTAQQQAIKAAAEHCGIRKGISREELLTAMKVCVPAYFKAQKGEGALPPSPSVLPEEPHE